MAITSFLFACFATRLASSLFHYNHHSPATTSSFRFTTSTSATARSLLLSMSLASNSAIAQRLVYGKDDALFGSIERQQGDDKPFGKMLDAGTGIHSLRWIATLRETKGLETCVAVTADETMQRNCQREVDALGVSDHVELVIGNWFDPQRPMDLELKEQQFDVILADYLIGAMDGFSPYTQDQMIPKLTRLLKPGGRLYIVGLQPIPDSVPNDPEASLICKVRQVRDACILLAGRKSKWEMNIFLARHSSKSMVS